MIQEDQGSTMRIEEFERLQGGWNKPKIIFVKLEKENALYPRYTRNWVNYVNV